MIHKDRLKERDTNLDIIRIVAACSVMYIHFYLNNGFYKQPIMGRRMYVMILMRTPVMICVPLFMILTGYLMSGRRFSIQSIVSVK